MKFAVLMMIVSIAAMLSSPSVWAQQRSTWGRSVNIAAPNHPQAAAPSRAGVASIVAPRISGATIRMQPSRGLFSTDQLRNGAQNAAVRQYNPRKGRQSELPSIH